MHTDTRETSIYYKHAYVIVIWALSDLTTTVVLQMEVL